MEQALGREEIGTGGRKMLMEESEYSESRWKLIARRASWRSGQRREVDDIAALV